jgi:hypothetical protein
MRIFSANAINNQECARRFVFTGKNAHMTVFTIAAKFGGRNSTILHF